MSSAGPRKLFKGMTTATSGVLARFPCREANVQDVYGFPWPPPGLLGIFFILQNKINQLSFKVSSVPINFVTL